jgi:alpha-glutamyl/putrescinyl thymine pyrophosphorylase clade 1
MADGGSSDILQRDKMKQTKEFLAFIKERHAIYERRLAGKSKPWTKDPILQQYRFCNMYRELDTVTIWLRENWRGPWKHDHNVWFAMVVARVVNWPDSLYDLAAAIHNGKKIHWNPREFVREMDARKTRGEKVWTGAYMIHADAAPGLSKAAYYAERVLTPIWDSRKEAPFDSLASFHKWLMQFRDMGSFMAAQVVADVKYTLLLAEAKDWWTWAAPGPGSLRGLSRVEFGDLGTKYTDAAWRDALAELKAKIDPMLAKAGMPRMHAQDLQNCLCEFDKYQRVLNGEGRPRSKYDGKGE